MKFFDEEHQGAYEKFISLDKTHEKDCERRSMFYLLSLNNETRNHIKSIYNFKEHYIEPSGLHQGWQTSESTAITRLGFNLYNGYSPVEEGATNSVLDVFALIDREKFDFVFQAIMLRFEMV